MQQAQSRIAPAAPPYEPQVQAAFDAITPPGRTPLLLFRTIAVAPRIYARFNAGGLLDRGALSLRQREIVILRICGRCRCEYEWGVHVAIFAAKAALTEAQIAATVDGRPADWSADEAALLAACDELDATTRLADATWTALRRHFDEAQVLELIALAGFYRTVCLYANGLALALEPFAARFPAAD